MIDSKKIENRLTFFPLLVMQFYSLLYFLENIKTGGGTLSISLNFVTKSPNVGRMSSELKFMSSQTHHLLIYVLLQLK